MPEERLKIFYDGACGVCAREMAHYRKIADDGPEFVDIAASDFDPDDFEPTMDDFLAEIHVQDQSGTFHTGVDAFRLIWQALPNTRYHLMATLIGLPVINRLARIGYRLFARNRERFFGGTSSCRHSDSSAE